MAKDRLNARLPEPLAKHVESMVAENGGTYETPSEYIRDLIRRDMEKRNSSVESILEGYQDLAAGRTFKSTGSFKKDLEKFDHVLESWEN